MQNSFQAGATVSGITDFWVLLLFYWPHPKV